MGWSSWNSYAATEALNESTILRAYSALMVECRCLASASLVVI